MEESILSSEEINKRAEEVFILDEGDYVYNVVVVSKTVYVYMHEIVKGNIVDFTFVPDMSGRPQALDYLMGKRGDFND